MAETGGAIVSRTDKEAILPDASSGNGNLQEWIKHLENWWDSPAKRLAQSEVDSQGTDCLEEISGVCEGNT